MLRMKLPTVHVLMLVVTTAMPAGRQRESEQRAPNTGASFVKEELYGPIMEAMPIPTVDVLIFSTDLRRTLLFNRTSPPVKHVWYSIGGRVLKNEVLRLAAVRKLRQELPLLAKSVTGSLASEFVLGGVEEEIFVDSVYPGVNSHCLNTVFGYVVPSDIDESSLQRACCDTQHSQGRWFDLDRDTPLLHPFMKRKLLLLLPMLHSKRAAAQLEVLERETGEASSRRAAGSMWRRTRVAESNHSTHTAVPLNRFEARLHG